MIGELDQRAGRENVEIGRGPGRLGSAGGRADEALAVGVGGNRRRQDARDRGDRSIERQFADDHVALKRVVRDGADRRHDAERDRQVVMAALLGPFFCPSASNRVHLTNCFIYFVSIIVRTCAAACTPVYWTEVGHVRTPWREPFETRSSIAEPPERN